MPASRAHAESREPTVACTCCGHQVSSLLDQVLDLPAFTIRQCRCGEIAVVVKAFEPAERQLRVGSAA